MKVSLIITTYNRPDALNLVLKSAFAQKRLPDEIVIADDGSGEETKELIQHLAQKSPIPILHAWQEDKGFRAAMARNRAIALSSGEYIVMIDGDMILHPCFIEDHLTAAEHGCFVQGGRVLLDEKATEKAIRESQWNFSIFSRGIDNRKNMLRCKFLTRILGEKSRKLEGIRTCNFSLFREDIFSVNGFDNRFIGWGREDSEFAARLLNRGLQRKNLKFSAVAFHLNHKESKRMNLPENDKKLQHTIENKSILCNDGIAKFRQG